MTAERRSFAAAHHLVVMVLLAAALIASLLGVVLLRRVQEPLAIHQGRLFPVLAVALYAGLAGTALTLILRARAWRLRTWTVSGGVEFRAAFDVGVGSLLFVVLYLQPARDVYLGFSAAIAAGCYAALLLLLQRADGAPRSSVTRAIDFLLFNACFLIVAIEVVLSIWGAFHPGFSFSRVDRGPAELVRSFRQSPGSARWGQQVNSQGYSDEEYRPRRPGEKQVIAIGDSFSTGAVPPALHYTRVCEREMQGVDVYNIGVPAIGPPEYLYLLLKEALPLNPDAIVIGLFVGNDIGFADSRSEGRERWRRWLAPQAYLTLSVPQRLLRIREERRRRPGGAVGEVQEASQATREQLESLAEFTREFPWMGDPTLEKPTFSEAAFAEIEAGRVIKTCWPRGTGGYGPLFSVLREIRDTCRNVPLLILLIPDEFQVDDEVWLSAEAGAKRKVRDTEFERFLPQQLIGEWLTEQGIAFVDMLPDARAVEPLEDGRRHLYHLRDTHFNTRGNEVAGKALARGLRALFAGGD